MTTTTAATIDAAIDALNTRLDAGDLTYDAYLAEAEKVVGAGSGHDRVSTTPQDDGTLLAHCSCGGTYTAPRTPDTAELDAAHVRHVAAC